MKTPEEISFAHGKAAAEADKSRCLPSVAEMMQRCDIPLRVRELPDEQMAAIDKAWYAGYDSAGISRVRSVDAKQAIA